MIAGIFDIVRLLLKLIGLWEHFLDDVEAKEIAEREKRRQDRARAIEDAKKAEGDDAIWESQDRIVDNQPKP